MCALGQQGLVSFSERQVSPAGRLASGAGEEEQGWGSQWEVHRTDRKALAIVKKMGGAFL